MPRVFQFNSGCSSQCWVAMALLWVAFASEARSEDRWIDITAGLMAQLTNNGARPAWPGGASGVVVNRNNGDLTVKVVGLGLWRSPDSGRSWEQVDGNMVSGRDETGWATSVDQNAPHRMASFSLDGSAGWTVDGREWRAFTTLGRNWDYGSVDWGTPNPKTIIAAKHETTPPGEVYASEDGGIAWSKLSIRLNENRGHISMVGALGPRILIHANGNGIERSTDLGVTWTKVSQVNPQTRTPTLFRDAYYLGSTNGIVVSKDAGSSWRQQGSPINIWQGPFFGRDEAQMVVCGADGIFFTADAGKTWKRLAGLKSKEGGFLFTPNWFGCYAWDHRNHFLYASAMGNPVYRLEVSTP